MTRFAGALVLLALALAPALRVAAAQGRETLALDRDWRFHLGDLPGAEQPAWDDSGWRRVEVPHDFSIEGPPGTNAAHMEGPFDPHSPGGKAAGYLNGGTGWYRTAFARPGGAEGRRTRVEFDGVFMDATVWLNGVPVGAQPYGYTGFACDLTPHLRAGTNVLAVRANVQQPCSRWYAGAGLYRRVRLQTTDPVHIAHRGTFVTTPDVSADAAGVWVRTRVQNESANEVEAALVTRVLDANGTAVAEQGETGSIPAGGEREFAPALRVAAPRCWSPDAPHLYRAVSEVRVGERVADRYETPFGIRAIEFAAEEGFRLNGRRVPLRGVCLHHDLGCLGVAVSRRAIERQLELLKAMGCNAVRTSHNPPAPELLELCDRLGVLVMDEAFDEWKIPKSGMKYGYTRFFDEWSERDLVSLIRRDRNHPSVILWSIGNEIKEQAAPQGGEMARRLAEICRREDPTRPVTSGMNKIGSALQNGFADAVDVIGLNYFPEQYQKQRGRRLLAAETASAFSTRGEYGLATNREGRVEIRARVRNQCTSYDLDHPGWGCTAEASLVAVRNAPWLAGEFVWTGFDYLGEPTPFRWPSRSSYFGILDTAGFPKDRYYLYQSQWTEKPVLHLLPHWNWAGWEGKEIPVWCYTSAESVELFLNGRSVGVRSFTNSETLHLEWKVPYEPGVLRAVGRKGGETLTAEVRTAGPAARLLARADRARLAADGEDLAFVEVRVTDLDGVRCPDATNRLTFAVEGPGRIAGVDSGDPTSHEPFQASARKAFHGLCLAVVRAGRQPGEIRLTVSAEGLPPERVSLSVAE